MITITVAPAQSAPQCRSDHAFPRLHHYERVTVILARNSKCNDLPAFIADFSKESLAYDRHDTCNVPQIIQYSARQDGKSRIKSRRNTLLTKRSHRDLIATVKWVGFLWDSSFDSGSRAYADVPVGGECRRGEEVPSRAEDVFPQCIAAARVAEPATEAAVQAVHGTAGWGVRGAMYWLEYCPLGPAVQI